MKNSYSVVTICLLLHLLNSCANSSRGPSGGPKDSIPPVLLNQYPAYKTTDFSEKEISFTFNEYVQLKDQNKKFIMSPPLEKRPVLKVRGKRVIVSFPIDLQPNTTYSIDFGTSVEDLNEGNPAEYLSTVFSTGETIDSLVYVGRLQDALSLEPVEGSFIFLYDENTDSIPFLKNPNALARSDKDGVYIIRGLKAINYKIVAVDDKNNNYRYDAGSEKIAFYDKTISAMQIDDSDSLSYDNLPIINMFTENVRKQFLLSYKQLEKRKLELIFNQINAQIISFDFENLQSNDFIIERNKWNDTLIYWIKPQTVPDTLKATLNYMRTDSLNQLSPTEVNLKFELKNQEEDNQSKPKGGKDNKKVEKPTLTPNINANSRKVIERNVVFSFKTPLIKFHKNSFYLYKYNDEGDKKELIKFTIENDSLHIREYTLKAKWEISSKYEVIILPNALTDIYSVSNNDTLTYSIETENPDKFSSLTVNLNNATKTYSYIIQLMQGKSIVDEKHANGNGKITFDYLDAAKYQIRIIEDKNNNKHWDTGIYLNKVQPERVSFVKFEDGTTEIDLRPNWDIEQTVDINLIFKDYE